jgi:hypothetical protein
MPQLALRPFRSLEGAATPTTSRPLWDGSLSRHLRCLFCDASLVGQRRTFFRYVRLYEIMYETSSSNQSEVIQHCRDSPVSFMTDTTASVNLLPQRSKLVFLDSYQRSMSRAWYWSLLNLVISTVSAQLLSFKFTVLVVSYRPIRWFINFPILTK